MAHLATTEPGFSGVDSTTRMRAVLRPHRSRRSTSRSTARSMPRMAPRTRPVPAPAAQVSTVTTSFTVPAATVSNIRPGEIGSWFRGDQISKRTMSGWETSIGSGRICYCLRSIRHQSCMTSFTITDTTRNAGGVPDGDRSQYPSVNSMQPARRCSRQPLDRALLTDGALNGQATVVI